MLKCGIVGLPNVGKSTTFNALTSTMNAQAANYPFCTIEPNSGIVMVPDERLDTLSKIAGSAKLIPACIEFVDIAGLVKGASKGEGLGNKFLSHIREVDAIVHVLRCFNDDNVTHVHGKVDPIYDASIIETELTIADLESIERRIVSVEKKAKSGDKESKDLLEILKDVIVPLEKGIPARSLLNKYDAKTLNSLQLITSKPVLYVCNVSEEDAIHGNELCQKVALKAKEEGANVVVISSKIESEISTLSNLEEKKDFLESIGLKEAGLDKVIKASYDLLSLKSFFTIGPKEAHAWTFKSGMLAPQAAGVIHTDFEQGFIRAEIIGYNDYINCGSEAKAKEMGKMRLEGKEYVMQDGDIVHFRFNV
jgi:GTP-binding protein YchF